MPSSAATPHCPDSSNTRTLERAGWKRLNRARQFSGEIFQVFRTSKVKAQKAPAVSRHRKQAAFHQTKMFIIILMSRSKSTWKTTVSISERGTTFHTSITALPKNGLLLASTSQIDTKAAESGRKPGTLMFLMHK
jgi:hypothetical protein